MTKLLLFITGACIGSFIQLAAQRLPQGGSIIHPPSHCDSCQVPLKWYQLIPIFSLWLQKFRCPDCGTKLSPSLMVPEIGCGLLFVVCLSGVSSPRNWLLLGWLVWAFTLALTDIYYYMIEPRIFLPGASVLWLAQFLLGADFLWLTLLYCLALFSLLHLFLRDRFGFGDVLLLLSWSPWLSFLEFTLLVTLAALLGLLLLLVFKKLRDQPLPFVPFLAIALAICLLK